MVALVSRLRRSRTIVVPSMGGLQICAGRGPSTFGPELGTVSTNQAWLDTASRLDTGHDGSSSYPSQVP